jgi:hypothetical protein
MMLDILTAVQAEQLCALIARFLVFPLGPPPALAFVVDEVGMLISVHLSDLSFLPFRHSLW